MPATDHEVNRRRVHMSALKNSADFRSAYSGVIRRRRLD
jgi:hypothetical protein